jgi:hypothetical protein
MQELIKGQPRAEIHVRSKRAVHFLASSAVGLV